MRVMLYHRNIPIRTEKPILERAAQRQHILKKTILWDIALLLLLSILGPVLHLYAPLLCRIPMVSVVIPANESVWEHLKLLFFPAALVGCIRYIWTGSLQKGILTTYASGLWKTFLLMVCGYYSIRGILGQMSLWADITLFYLCVIFLTIYIRRNAAQQKKNSLPGALFLLLLTGCFIRFTYHPPEIGLFMVS